MQNIHKFTFLSQSTKYPEVRECVLCITVGLEISTQPGTPQIQGINVGMEACAFLTI